MKYKRINDELNLSKIALGCMRIGKLNLDEVENLIKKAIELGINFFDHADIYGAGKCEELFGEVLKRNPSLREKIVIQSKCGIRRGFYDSSKEHIITSVTNSLNRLKTSYLDILLIHRPDTLMEIDEISEAFKYLHENGMVKYFGVSNMDDLQIELIQSKLNHKILFNQVQLSIVHSLLFDSEFNVNMKNQHNHSTNRVLNHARLNNITIQAWGVLQASWEEGSFLNHPSYPVLNAKLTELASIYNVTPSAISISWILRHPAEIIPIVGTTSIKHLEELVKACDITISRKEFYELYLASGKTLP